MLCIVLLLLCIAGVPKATLRFTSVNSFSLGGNSVVQEIAEKNCLDSEMAVQDVRSKGGN